MVTSSRISLHTVYIIEVKALLSDFVLMSLHVFSGVRQNMAEIAPKNQMQTYTNIFYAQGFPVSLHCPPQYTPDSMVLKHYNDRMTTGLLFSASV